MPVVCRLQKSFCDSYPVVARPPISSHPGRQELIIGSFYLSLTPYAKISHLRSHPLGTVRGEALGSVIHAFTHSTDI